MVRLNTVMKDIVFIFFKMVSECKVSLSQTIFAGGPQNNVCFVYFYFKGY